VELSTAREATTCAATRYFPAFYGTRRFITEFTRAFQLYLSWARPIQSTTFNPISKRSILMLSIHLRLGLPSCLFPYGFPTNNLYTFLFSPIRATCPAHLILFNFIILINQLARKTLTLTSSWWWNSVRSKYQQLITGDVVPSFPIPPKHLFLQKPHGAISQKRVLFIVHAVKTSNLIRVDILIFVLYYCHVSIVAAKGVWTGNWIYGTIWNNVWLHFIGQYYAYKYKHITMLCKIWGFHGGDYEEWCLLGCYVVWIL
jgi:hypothetical protein